MVIGKYPITDLVKEALLSYPIPKQHVEGHPNCQIFTERVGIVILL
jgi:hypothetical protein